MNLKDYFEHVSGTGVLATADSEGRVDAALYSRPYVMDEQTIAFIMADRLTRKNLQSNAQAAYLFHESGKEFMGKRLYLTKIKEGKGVEESEQALRQRYEHACQEYPDETLFLVYFRVDNVLPLVMEKE